MRIITLILFFLTLASANNLYANQPVSSGKFKNWETFTFNSGKGKICFAQTLPTKRAPASVARDKSKLFVTVRPSENIRDEAIDVRASNSTIYQKMLEKIKNF